MRVTIELAYGADHRDVVTSQDIQGNIDALNRVRTGHTTCADDTSILDTISILRGIQAQLLGGMSHEDTPRVESLPSAIDPVTYRKLQRARRDAVFAEALCCTCSSHCLQVEGCCCARGKAIKLTRERVEELLRLI